VSSAFIAAREASFAELRRDRRALVRIAQTRANPVSKVRVSTYICSASPSNQRTLRADAAANPRVHQLRLPEVKTRDQLFFFPTARFVPEKACRGVEGKHRRYNDQHGFQRDIGLLRKSSPSMMVFRMSPKIPWNHRLIVDAEICSGGLGCWTAGAPKNPPDSWEGKMLPLSHFALSTLSYQ